MKRILATFLILASAFICPPARAQETVPDQKAQAESATSDDSMPFPVMHRMGPAPAIAPGSPLQPGRTAPVRSEGLSHSSAGNQKSIINQDSTDWGLNPHMKSLNAPAAGEPEKKETPEPYSTGVTQPDFAELRQMDTATVDQIIDPLHIQMKDGRIIQLTGVDITDFDVYDPGDLSLAARDLLTNLLKNKQVRLFQTRDNSRGRTNRMGYVLAHLQDHDGLWIQGALLDSGLARVRPSGSNPEMAAAMMKLEDGARTKKKGLWADQRYALLTPETAAQAMNGWAVVEGAVVSVATVNNMIYLNFGPDWHTDFTVTLTPDVRREFQKTGLDPLAFGGKKIRVHGWIEDYNGPSIERAHPVWLELLPDASENSKNN